MSEVRYSVNGKYFKDFGTYVSDSDGLFDALKRKKVNSYDWAEYHGESPDLSSPKFEAREITLKCFVVGDDWVLMKSNFDAIISEFQKAGTQRLLIEPLGLKVLPYEVCMIDDVNLKKTFKDGQMIGLFTIKLIEPNPIKKVLYFTGETLNLSYTSPSETEIFYGNGLKDVVKGNASLNGKAMPNSVVSGYNFEGRNLFRNSNDIISGADVVAYNREITELLVVGEEYVLSYDIKSSGNFVMSNIFLNNSLGIPGSKNLTTSYQRFFGVFKFVKNDYLGREIMPHFYSSGFTISVKNIKLEKGTNATDWTPSPEEEKYIIIAGDVDAIANVTTNAEVLWEKL